MWLVVLTVCVGQADLPTEVTEASAPTPAPAADTIPTPTPATTPSPLFVAPERFVSLSLRTTPLPTEETPLGMGPAATIVWQRTVLLQLGGTLAGHFSHSANEDWRFSRSGLLAQAHLGLHTAVGVGTAFMQLNVGFECLWEKRTRQDAARVSGLASVQPRWRYSLGPTTGGEAGVRLVVWDPVAVEFAVGLLGSRHKVAKAHTTVLGPTSRLGLTYAF